MAQYRCFMVFWASVCLQVSSKDLSPFKPHVASAGLAAVFGISASVRPGALVVSVRHRCAGYRNKPVPDLADVTCRCK
jgi:hypothetical protein